MTSLNSSKSTKAPTILELTGHKNVQGDIGIELEIEGSGLVPAGGPECKYWFGKPESSLRDGFEYVLAKPIRLDKLPDACNELKGLLGKASKLRRSIRCSTHFHINVLPLTIEQLYNFYVYYYLVEDFLVGTQGPLRVGNLFCLRMSDAEGVAQRLVDSIERREMIFHFSKNENKYGALNLAAPAIFGSVEFRFFRPMTILAEMEWWARLLYRLVRVAADIPMEVSLDTLENQGSDALLKLVFTKDDIDELKAAAAIHGMTGGYLEESFKNNFDMVSWVVREFKSTYSHAYVRSKKKWHSTKNGGPLIGQIDEALLDEAFPQWDAEEEAIQAAEFDDVE